MKWWGEKQDNEWTSSEYSSEHVQAELLVKTAPQYEVRGSGGGGEELSYGSFIIKKVRD